MPGKCRSSGPRGWESLGGGKEVCGIEETVKQRDGRMWLQECNGITGALYKQL